MEFVHHDGIKLNKIYIDHMCNFIEINGDTVNVNKIGLFTENEGKCETDDHVIKYSKRVLYLYDKSNNILGVYKFSKYIPREAEQEINISTETGMNIKALIESFDEESGIILNKFILKKDYNIYLFRTRKGDYFIKVSPDSQDMYYEPVVETYGIGSDILYVTNSDNKLQISTKRNSKWNGIPIGKIN